MVCLVQSELCSNPPYWDKSVISGQKVMCNGNDYISNVMVMVMITFLKRM